MSVPNFCKRCGARCEEKNPYHCEECAALTKERLLGALQVRMLEPIGYAACQPLTELYERVQTHPYDHCPELWARFEELRKPARAGSFDERWKNALADFEFARLRERAP